MSAPATTVDMRHTKLSAEDAALIAGEVVKPSWASRNEGIHERISFNDTLWGFELAGGSFYKTPLRVVYVKPGSRAEQACIRMGDTVLRINDIDTSTLTLQEAHDIVLESGIHLRIAVTSPDDDEDAYYTYQDAVDDAARLEEELRKAREAERIRRAIERANRKCNLPWPWVRRKIIIYRESNCFLVPSTYESKHKEKYPELPHVRYTDDISEMNRGTRVEFTNQKATKDTPDTKEAEPVKNGDVDFDNQSVMDEKEQNKIIDEILNETEDEVENKNIPSDIEETTHSDVETPHSDMNGEVLGPDSEEDGAQVTQNGQATFDEEAEQVDTNVADRLVEEVVDSVDEILEENNDSQVKEEIETETNENKESNLNEENRENDDITNVPMDEDEDLVNKSEDDVVGDNNNEFDNIVGDKSEEDNVVDGIVGDGLDDSINER